MKKVSILISLLLFISFLLASCSGIVQNTVSSGSESGQNEVSSDTSFGKVISNNKIGFLAVREAKGIDEAEAAFAIDMLKLSSKDGENCMISPLSILTALGMTANGASGDTLKEMQDILFGGKSIYEFNAYYKELVGRITEPSKGTLSLANSTWYRNEAGRLKMNEDFIKLVTDNYKSEIKPADFNDKNTVNLINGWVKDNTNGYIDKIINEIDPDTVIYLINALYFEEKWESQFVSFENKENTFHTKSGDVKATFMHGDENYYIKDDIAEGIIKRYEGGEFSFAAIMPKEGMTAEKYLSGLTGKKVLDLLKNKVNKPCGVWLPKFKAEFNASLVDPLKNLGMASVFDSNKADLAKMAISSNGNIFVSDVIHKTFIEVNEQGTKAAAATGIEVKETAYIENMLTINFNRPFIYMIIDNETNLPLFIGIMNNPAK